MATKKISTKEQEQLLLTLQERFEKNMKRHKGVKWTAIETKLKKSGSKLAVVHAMEKTGGEPDVVVLDKKTGLAFVDCSAQSPKRRSVCYDKKARTGRKKFPPKSSAEEMAKELGVELLTEEQYRALQTFGEFDTTTSSWIATPTAIRKHGGALFADRRYDHVFVYHNGADSYYAARGFRGLIRI